MTRCEHRDDPDPQGRSTLALAAEELFLVGVLRSWVAAQRPGVEDAPTWGEIFDMAELPTDVGAAFGGLMAAVARTMRRALDIRCRRCPQVGADEEAMLRILRCMQDGDRLGAVDDLAEWLVPEGIMPALGAAQRFVTLLSSHDVVLTRQALPAPSSWIGTAQGTRPH